MCWSPWSTHTPVAARASDITSVRGTGTEVGAGCGCELQTIQQHCCVVLVGHSLCVLCGVGGGKQPSSAAAAAVPVQGSPTVMPCCIRAAPTPAHSTGWFGAQGDVAAVLCGAARSFTDTAVSVLLLAPCTLGGTWGRGWYQA